MIARIIVMENISFETWPRIRPCAARIRENSETWAKDIEVRKDVLFVYLNTAHDSMTISGLNRMTIRKNTSSGKIIFLRLINAISRPSETKNKIEKKSLNGFI